MDGGYLGPSVGYQQLVNYQAEYSMTADDVPKRLVLGHVYELPIGKGKALGSNWNGPLDKVLGHLAVLGDRHLPEWIPYGDQRNRTHLPEHKVVGTARI